MPRSVANIKKEMLASLPREAGHKKDKGELKVLEGTHGTEPMGLLGREVGLEKHTKKPFRKRLTSLNLSGTSQG